ncbi:MAG: glycosyltransferase family 39 protein [Candidatus Omnitrophica bacterium]|nr:glycosyltransferase family 39 protein [Candidatus Omnitrophota bacterium]
MIVFAFLPLVFILLLWRWLTLRGLEAREALLAANVISGVLIVFSTEALSPIRQINFFSLLTFWSLLVVAISFMIARIASVGRWSWPCWSLTWIEKVLLSMAAFIVLVVGFIALYAPPNTWDSMTYHMARVGHWRQNSSVMNYPTNIIRQLVYLPFAEYIILHLQILSGGDRCANMVQWSAMVCSALGVSLAAGLLGASRLGQITAALLALTLPMGILQGSSTQNDYVVAFLVLCTACFALKVLLSGQGRWLWLTAAGAGLAAFTKGSGWFLAVTAVLVVMFSSGVGIRRKAWLLILTLFMVGIINGSFLCRLTQVDKNVIVAMKKGGDAAMVRVGGVEIVSNVLKNAATQLALPGKEWNRFIESVVLQWDKVCNIPAEGAPLRLWYYLDEDYMPNSFHMFLVVIAGALFWRVRNKERVLWFFVMTGLCQTLMFCILAQWNPFISRLHLPLFIMAMPLVAVVFEKAASRKLLIGAVLVAFLVAIQPLVLNNTRRLLSEKSLLRFSRTQNYFAKHPGEYSLVDQVSESLNGMGCRNVGIILGSDAWEYTWQALLGPDVRVEHVNVVGPVSALGYPLGEFTPCAVIDLGGENISGADVFNGRQFIKAAEIKGFRLYLDPKRNN